MPGLTGASIFSPRPARGYGFHSLQVEIIVIPSRHASRNQSMKLFSQKLIFVAIRVSYHEIGSVTSRKTSRAGRSATQLTGQSTVIMATVEVQSFSGSASITRSRPARPLATRACGRWEPGGRSRRHKKHWEVNHAKQSPDRRAAASEKRGQGNSRRGRDGGERERGDLSRRVRQTRPVQG